MALDEHPGNGGNSPLPTDRDFAALADRDLCDELERMGLREREISFQRRFLHGQIQLARTELARRLTRDTPLAVDREVLSGIDRLLDGLDIQEDR